MYETHSQRQRASTVKCVLCVFVLRDFGSKANRALYAFSVCVCLFLQLQWVLCVCVGSLFISAYARIYAIFG